METPDKIWLIEEGGELVWCDCPTPAPGMEEKYATLYVKPEVQDKLTRRAIAEAIGKEIDSLGLGASVKALLRSAIINCRGGLFQYHTADN